MSFANKSKEYTICRISSRKEAVWLKKLFQRWRLWCSLYLIASHTVHQRTLTKVHTLDPQLFANYQVSTGCVYPLKVLYTDFEAYNKRLRHANYLLANKLAVANSWCHYEWTQTSLERMWATSKGIRADPVKVIAEFKSLTLTFLEHYDLIKDEFVDTDGHNARMLATFKTSVLILVDDLLHYTLS